MVQGIETIALLDTGSQITTMSQSFYQDNFPAIPLQDCVDMLRIQGVSGEHVPYDGFLLTNVSIPTTSLQLTRDIPVFVVPNTTYNKKVPLLLGTNFLQQLVGYSSAELQTLSIPLQVAAHALQLNNRHLEKSNGVYSHITAADDINIPAYSGKVTVGHSVIVIPVKQQIALLQQSTSEIPVVNALVEVNHGNNSIPVEIVNNSPNTLHISKGDEIAKLHQASVELPEVDTKAQFLQHFDFSHLNSQDTEKLKTFLLTHRNLFATDTSEMGCTDTITHRIELENPAPFKDKSRPIPPGAYNEVRQHIAELLTSGVIKPSRSPYSSNMVLVRKKDGSLRLCVDYRRLNNATIKDAYSIPRIDTLIDSLKGARYFASLDLFSGYHQVKVADEHQERTAFSAGPLGFYEFVKMPFGLCNAPATFQRMMERVLDGLNMNICAVYLDDVIVYASTEEEMYERLSKVFSRFLEANLRLKPSKCRFFQHSVEFLGHEVSEHGVQCCKKHLEAVAKWPTPTSVKELQTFLGFVNFYRKFIRGYASIADPLYSLLRGDKTAKKPKHSHKHNKPANVKWEWGEKQRVAFARLKELLTSPPILAYPDFDKDFVVHVDASRSGLGAVLYQKNGDRLEVLAYASKSLLPSERNYSAHKLEFLGLKWAVTVKFRHYLYGKPFTVYTDHNPLAYVLTTAKLDAVGHRWLAEISDFQFQVNYKPGKRNNDADGLSRRPYLEPDKCTETITPEVFKEVCTVVNSTEGFSGVADSLGVSPSVLSNVLTVGPVHEINWDEEQRSDNDLSRVMDLVLSGGRLSNKDRQKESPAVLRLLSFYPSLIVEEGVLYKVSHAGDDVVKRIVVPVHRRQSVLEKSHNDLGHLGRDKTLSVAKDRYFWPGLTKDIEEFIKTCPRCLRAKAPHLPERAPLCNIVTTHPLELVCMDFLSLETSRGGYKHVLVITDHFTKYSCAYPTRSQHASVVAKILVEQFIVHYGIPERLHSDQGANFEGRVIKHLCELLGMRKSRTTPYHPQGDGITERFNRTLISMLSTLELEQKVNWKEHVAPMVHAYNCMRHESTGYTPFYLMFGRTPRLPVDMFLGVKTDFTNTVSSIQDRLDKAYKAATEATRRAAKHQAQVYNRKIRGHSLREGDFVLVKNVGIKGKHKLADKWRPERYVVRGKPNKEIPVYEVVSEDGSVVKVLHRNMLLPLTLPVQCSLSDGGTQEVTGLVEGEGESGDSSSEQEFCLYHSDPSRQVVPESDVSAASGADVHMLSTPDQSVGEPEPMPEISTPNVSDQTVASPVSESGRSPMESPRAGDSNPPNDPRQDHSPHQPEPSEADDNGVSNLVHPSGRPRRQTRLPARLANDYILNSQRVCVDDWRDRVSILLSLVGVFPEQSREICAAILRVISM